MNIDDLKEVVIKGQIATLQAQIVAWQEYSTRTGVIVTPIIQALQAQITALNQV